MNKYFLNDDINLFCVTADSFPEGILKSHQELHSLLPSTKDRTFYGISRPNNKNVIIYKAAVEELFEGEAEKYNCEKVILKKGEYISRYVYNYPENIAEIGNTFKQLLSTPGLDPDGYCVEKYIGDRDVLCMIKLSNNY